MFRSTMYDKYGIDYENYKYISFFVQRERLKKTQIREQWTIGTFASPDDEKPGITGYQRKNMGRLMLRTSKPPFFIYVLTRFLCTPASTSRFSTTQVPILL